MALNSKDAENARFTFTIYDFDGSGSMDAVYLGSALRALNLTPTLVTISSLGGTQRKGEKEFSLEEFIKVYGKAREIRDSETMEDILECLRTNDKHGNGTISSSHLAHLLQTYGERLEPEEVDDIIRDCGNPQNGIISYAPFLENLLSGPDRIGNLDTTRIELAANESMDILANEVGPSPVHNLKSHPHSFSEELGNSEPFTPTLVNAAFSLKSKKSRAISASEAENAKKAATAAAEAVLKPKNQMPLISMKTKGLIGNIVKK